MLQSLRHQFSKLSPFSTTKSTMIQVGDRVPEFTFMTAKVGVDGACAAPKPIKASEVFAAGKTVVLVSVPGAFTPVCSEKHVPAYLEHYEQLKGKGVDEIALTSVNDAFVMAYWAKQLNATDKMTVLADGSAQFAKQLGLTMDLTEKGMGVRAQRYAMLVRDGIVKYVGVDPTGQRESSAEAILTKLN